MNFNPGFGIHIENQTMGFTYGACVFGPEVERRSLDSIRKSLFDPDCKGPDPVYAIAMDVGKINHKKLLEEKHLLFGAVTYAAGRLGKEPVRSQGHSHKKSAFAGGWSTPEVYEIWEGKAIILMQESAQDDPGRCFAVEAGSGEIVIVPPGWAHATISAGMNKSLTFGAWCDREYGFEYEDVRNHRGLAWFPFMDEKTELTWTQNPNYKYSELTVKSPREYGEFGIETGKPIYTQFEEDPDKFLFVPRPDLYTDKWTDFVP